MTTTTSSSPSTVAILGAGRVSRALALPLAAAGYQVLVGSRNPKADADKWRDGTAAEGVRHVTLQQAAEAAPLVINATPGATAVAALSPLRDALAGKTLVDVANATERLPNGMPGGLVYPGSSLAEQLQQALPQTRVVKSLNTMLFSVMANPRSLASPPTAFVSGDDAQAKAQVTAVLAALGWPGEWVLDIGGLASARATEAMMLIVPQLIQRFGFAPFALSVAR